MNPAAPQATLRRRQPRQRDERGIALIIAMVAIFVLAILAGGFAHSMKVETVLARNSNSEAQLEWLGRSGVEYAKWVLAQQLQCTSEPYDALTQKWAGGSGGACVTNGPLADVVDEIHLGTGSFTWKIADLERKWNINTANEDLLRQALVVMGVDASEMPAIVGSILDWIDPDDNTHLEGAESDYYRGLNPSYEAKNAPLDDISELLFIKGITREIYLGTSASNSMAGRLQMQLGRNGSGNQIMPPSYPVGLADLFTPISGGKININTASAFALQLIPGIDPPRAEAIVAAREGEDDGSNLGGPYRSVDPGYLFNRVPNLGLDAARQVARFADIRSRTFEVRVEATVGSYHRTFVAIVARTNPRDIQTLNFYWK